MGCIFLFSPPVSRVGLSPELNPLYIVQPAEVILVLGFLEPSLLT
jgi:hypothetical protein